MNGGNPNETETEQPAPAPVEIDENGNPVEPKTDETGEPTKTDETVDQAAA